MDPPVPELELDNLRAIKLLGKGAIGTVLLVHDKLRDPYAVSPFALKIILKSSPHKADRRARWELSVLTRLSNPTFSHPFLPALVGSFETCHIIGWASEYCPGGDLNSLRFKYPDRSFSPAIIKFYLAEILCALNHLHTMGIVYRDLKPENILVQKSGHLTLTDFDLSRACLVDLPSTNACKSPHPRKNRKWFWSHSRVSPVIRGRSVSASNEGQRCNSFVGTEEYVSPEMVRGGTHGFAIDWWALGILAYEMLYGKTPFKGKNKKETYYNILTKPPPFVGKSTALTDLIQRLLEKEQTKRLGYGKGAGKIKQHEFFCGVQWDLLTDVSRPPFIPSRAEELVTEELRRSGVDVGENFKGLASPASVKNYQHNISLTEF